MPFVLRYDLSEIYIHIYRIQNNDLIDHYVYRIRSNVLIDHYVSEMLESLSVCYSFIVMCSHIETPIYIYKLYPHQVKPYQFLPARICTSDFSTLEWRIHSNSYTCMCIVLFYTLCHVNYSSLILALCCLLCVSWYLQTFLIISL